MARGGARNRSGPPPEAGSNRSEARGLSFNELPATGYVGPVPEFPLPDATQREHEVWAELWQTPQAAAWAVEEWRWHTVAMYARILVRAEDPDAPVGVLQGVHRFADQVGMTPAGLKENGWAVRQPDIVPASGESAPSEVRGRRLRAAQ